jgi:hypothetical protein
MNLIDVSREILGGCGYQTHAPKPVDNVFHFEDDTLLGFVAVHPDVPALLARWREQQDIFVKTQARLLRDAPVKAWNVYSVFLTSAVGSPGLRDRMIAIEEDFSGTRKLLRQALVTRDDVVRALYPLIPVQNVVVLSEADAVDRLRTQLELPPRTLDELLESGSAAGLADSLEGDL